MLTKISEKLILAATFFLVICFYNNALLAHCPPTSNIQKDSTTLTHVHFSWDPVPGAINYEVRYITPTDTFDALVLTPNVAIPLPFSQAFEQIWITTDCGLGGPGGVPASETYGGLIITIVDIFGRISRCDSSDFKDEYLFFEDKCKYCRASDLCELLREVGSRSQFGSDEEWHHFLMQELEGNPSRYNWEDWFEGPCESNNPSDGGGRNALGLQEAGSTEWSVFPNPFLHTCNIKVNGDVEGAYSITVYDVQGRVVMLKHGELEGTEQTIRLNDGYTLATGIYTLRLEIEGASKSLRIIKQ